MTDNVGDGKAVICFSCLLVHPRSDRKPWTYKGKRTGLRCCPRCEHTTELK